MKASIILALPFLSLAAAAPAKADKRIDLSKILEPLDCPLEVASLIPDCLPRASDGQKINLEPLTMCLRKLGLNVERTVKLEEITCIYRSSI
ncbi:uncharacterized protein FIESC28_10061 [Fusarium coffeatum]|uniref:Hydrophobin n=1 Tax=Fusarium coffeatum TaxID=231269 RepID=A0A366QXR4_9HYPO|nr:uncharacterized protein FIESC28_10061 [Fusarium coffeatum]RBR08998.1 hypothetical protein FIESC28_10061 [Fusarium coffeatum]